ncbi:hypothetical protein AB3U99_21320 [Niallia sp. JL1B1071]|uniref:hypothetical protein n=1 Tax=Niallia tiangongensis TaxID=3237105 RepID=UPI0037DD7BE5
MALNNSGELDFYIYSLDVESRAIAIGENKEWGNYTRQLKQLIGYMNENVLFGFTIVFNKKTKLQTVLESRKEIVQNFCIELNEEKLFQTVSCNFDILSKGNMIVSSHKNPENNKKFNIYHFIVNTYRPEREEAAKQARKR